MRKVVASLCFLLVSYHAQAAQVQDVYGRPIPFARISILGQSGWIVADAKGNFSLPEKLNPPLVLVVTGADGVVLGSFSFANELPEPLVLVVTPSQETVTVVAARPPDLVVPPATAFSSASQAQIHAEAPAQLVDALATVPGVGRTGFDHAAVPALRGLAKFRSLILVDDTRVLTERRAGPSASFLDPLTLGELEVVRGAAGVAYGSDAFGGVIAARTRLASPGEPWRLRFSLGSGWGMPEQSAHVDVGGSLGSGAMTIGAASRDFDPYRSPKAEIYNSQARFRSFRWGYQLPLDRGMLRLLWRSDWGRDMGRPTATSRVDRTYYPEENSHRLIVGFEGPLSGRWTRWAWTLGWVEYQLLTARDRAPTATRPRSLTVADVSSHDYNARVELEGTLAGGQLMLGVDTYGRFGLKATNTTTTFADASNPARSREVSIANARKDDFGLFVAYQRQLFEPLSVSTGVRADYTRSRNRQGFFGNQSQSLTRGSGFAAVTARISPHLDAAVQFSRGFRDAVLSDRFYRGISGRGFITGNPNLKPETSQQWDASLRYRKGPFHAALYAYYYDIFNMIERYKQGHNYFFRNRAQGRLRGLEAEGGVRLPQDLELMVGLQDPEGKVVDDGTYLDDIPARGGFVLLKQRLQRWSWDARWSFYARDSHPGPTETVVPGFAVVDAGASYRVSSGLEVSLRARNLLDHAYPGDNEPGAVLAPGRSVLVFLRGTL
ncbi:MAG: TonB-dependent receptor [Thermoanaerobaculum sp.]